MIKYNFDEFMELDDENKIEYFFKHLEEIQSKVYFTYRERILEEPEENELTSKKKLKLLDCLDRELNRNLEDRIQNRFDSSGLNPNYEQYISFEANTRDYVKDIFAQIFNQDFKKFFTGKSDTNIDSISLEKEIIEHPTFWPYY